MKELTKLNQPRNSKLMQTLEVHSYSNDLDCDFGLPCQHTASSYFCPIPPEKVLQNKLQLNIQLTRRLIDAADHLQARVLRIQNMLSFVQTCTTSQMMSVGQK